ncbi:MAG: TIGR04255 family protein [Phycisphaeraceae bacterium]|nr:MAG: TIGR04255 family protein [Phycisphaeraceae bacterium]
MASTVSLNLDEEFPALRRAPIVEAMITLVARATLEWAPDAIFKQVTARLPDYPTSQHMNQARFSFAMQADAPRVPPVNPATAHATAENLGWLGLRLVSADQRRVVTLARNSLSLSWLGEYVGWSELSAELMRLLTVHREIAGIESIDQMQIRYVNRLEVPQEDFEPGLYFTGFGTPPAGMVQGPFLHQDTLAHPSFPQHVVNLVRTFEQPTALSRSLPLLVVLEAIHAEPVPVEPAMINQRLREMHWLKNYAFFQSVTMAFRDLCQ